ncbi:MAG TPA: DUF4232 domain-containing protein [Trebonia sp.]|jgi:hypothetical protein|nr:DUF4232 domain-containing protein [Trebonia sp.]
MFKHIRRTIIATATALTLGAGGAVWATTAASAAPAAIPSCTTANLAVWVDVSQGSGAAGTIFYPLDFTNTSNHACTLYGYPGVSATNANGRQLGRAAQRDPRYKARKVTIGAGGSAHAILSWVEIGNFTASGCKPANASLIRVYPPNRKSAAYGFFSLQACTSTKKLYQYLFVTTVQPGVGHAV